MIKRGVAESHTIQLFHDPMQGCIQRVGGGGGGGALGFPTPSLSPPLNWVKSFYAVMIRDIYLHDVLCLQWTGNRYSLSILQTS